jgi:hypothetical protein
MIWEEKKGNDTAAEKETDQIENVWLLVTDSRAYFLLPKIMLQYVEENIN